MTGKVEINDVFRSDIDKIFSGIDEVFDYLYTSPAIEELEVAMAYKKCYENLKYRIEDDYALSIADVEKFKDEVIDAAEYLILYKQTMSPEMQKWMGGLMSELHKTFIMLTDALKSVIAASSKENNAGVAQ